MKGYAILSWMLCFSVVMGFTQPNYLGNLGSADTGEPEQFAAGMMRYFVESDYQARLGNTERAITILDNAIIFHPFFAETYLKRAELLAHLGRTAEAKRDREMAVRLNPHVVAFFGASQRLGRMQLVAFDREGYGRLASEHLSDAAAQELEQSIEKKLEGDLVGAMVDLRNVFDRVDQPKAKLYNLRGNLHFLLQDYNEAIADYTDAIQQDPEAGAYYFNRGVARLFTYDRLAACRDLEMSERLGYEPATEKRQHFCFN